MSEKRAILHVDMDAFYASVEQLDDPGLAGKAVIVGGTGPRGVVCAASYEARRFGVHSAMPGRQARQRCPQGVFIAPRMARYREVSAQVFAIFHRFTPLVEGLSLDEAFLDVSILAADEDITAIGRAIKTAIRAETGLTASVGMGPNKLIAKIASKLDKPDGLVHIPAEQAADKLAPLPVGVIWGIGPRAQARLEEAGIRSVGQLRGAPLALLRAVFGRDGERYRCLASGIDARPVVSERPDRSVSAEETFAEDLAAGSEQDQALRDLVRALARRLSRKHLLPATLTLKVREADFTTHTRSRSFQPPGNRLEILLKIAEELLDDWRREFPDAAIRLLGIGGSRFQERDQFELFSDPGAERARELAATVDAVRERFGSDGLRSASEIVAGAPVHRNKA